ncbi:MAG: aspartate kinase [Saprospiraceae bacterium]
MKIMKFGGTSVGKPERMKEVSRLITADQESKIVVLSALSGTTNKLVEISKHCFNRDKVTAKAEIDALEVHYRNFIKELLHQDPTYQKAESILNEHFDFLNITTKVSYSEALNKDILAQGELLSTKLFSCYLEENGIAHHLLPALDFMVIDVNDEPQIPMIRSKLLPILAATSDSQIYVTQGYICLNARGEVDNLKRGGSDYSASLIAAAVQASVCEIWTDIDGMHNNDPRIVKITRPVEQLSFDEAAELAYFGAKILHPATIWPAQQEHIPVKLLNTMAPQAKGTLISKSAASQGVKAVAAKDGIVSINIKSSRMLLAYGFLRSVFAVFEKYKTPIDMITTSEVAVSMTIDQMAYINEIIAELGQFGAVSVTPNQTIISIVGHNLVKSEDLLENIFACITHIPVSMVSYGGSPHNVSILVPADHKNETLVALNKKLFGLD